MRVGQNPAKSVCQLPKPEKVTVAVVSYIPFLEGYYSQSLDVLEVCLGSLWKNTGMPFDLLVFDNASCPEVRGFLEEKLEQGRIQYLVLSEKNVGVPGAWNFIFRSAPGEFVAYADSDVYFYPGWLSALLRVFEIFPNVGMLTGMPLLNPEKFSTSTVSWAEREPLARLERGRTLSWEDYWRHAGTLGSDEEQARAFYEQNEALLLEYRDQRCYAGAGHFQFVARRAVLEEALPLPAGRPMGEERLLDIRLNELGYLRLSTPEWWVQHLGNRLQGQNLPEGVSALSGPPGVRAKKRGSVWRWKPVRNMLTWINGKTFDILYRS